MSNMFEFMAATEVEDIAVARKAVALARVRADKRFSKFVSAAVSDADREARLTLVAGDLAQTVKQACAEVGHEDWEGVLAAVGERVGLVVEARRPKMCPVHREVVDISLGSGDPQAGFNAMANQLFGEHSCRGGAYDGRCNFKPEMVAQSFWDKRQEDADARRQERLEQEAAPDVKPGLIPEQTYDEVPESSGDTELSDDYADAFGADDNFGSPLDVDPEPMAMAAKTTMHKAAVIPDAHIHSGPIEPLREISERMPGLVLNGMDHPSFENAHYEQVRQGGSPIYSVEVTHPNPRIEALAANILQAGHAGPLEEFKAENRARAEARRQQEMGGGQPVAASFREAEALETISLGEKEGPSPKMDKTRWRNDLKPVDTEMKGSPVPTEHQDIAQPAVYEKDFDPQIGNNLEEEDLLKSKNPTDGGGPATSTFPNKNQADPVTSKQAYDQGGDFLGEPSYHPDNYQICENCGRDHADPNGVCPHCGHSSHHNLDQFSEQLGQGLMPGHHGSENPIARRMEDAFVDPAVTAAAIATFNRESWDQESEEMDEHNKKDDYQNKTGIDPDAEEEKDD